VLTIFFIFIFINHASYILEKFSDFCYNKNMTFCKHVYQEMEEEICPICGGYTHKLDWAYQAELHREWIASGKATLQGWWSI